MTDTEKGKKSDHELLRAVAQIKREVASTWASTATDENYREADGGFYWEDDDHVGEIFVSQQMVDKYDLAKTIASPIEEWFEDEDDGDEWRDELQNFSHYIIATRCIGFTKARDDGENPAIDTPRGKIYSNEFTAWWNDIPLELFAESGEDVFIK